MRWSPVDALAASEFELAKLEGKGWTAYGIDAHIAFQSQPLKARLRIQRATIAMLNKGGETDAQRELRDIVVTCINLELSEARIACVNATIAGVLPSLGSQQLHANLSFDRRSEILTFVVDDVRLAQGRARITGNWSAKGNDTRWNAQINLLKADAPQLLKWIGALLPSLPVTSSQGSFDAEVKLNGKTANVSDLSWIISARNLTLANVTGSIATEKLMFSSQGSARFLEDSIAFDTSVTATAGQGYAEPVFLNFADHNLDAKASGTWKANAIDVQAFTLTHRDALSATGAAKINLGNALAIETLRMTITEATFPGAYLSYLQPFLVGTSFNALKTAGTLAGEIVIVANAPANLQLRIADLSLDDGHGNWQLDHLAGNLDWQAQRRIANSPTSQLTWQGGKLFGMSLGQGGLEFATADRDFVLSKLAHLPLVDGSVDIASLRVSQAGLPEMTLSLDATLQPVSVAQLSTAFGWPPFGGQISGRLADLQLRNGVVTLGTTLHAEVFDGRVSIDKLRMENALSQWPRFSANIAIDHVDLEQVTNAFSFGRITGRLSGNIEQLQLFNWQPIAFDAKFFTPNDDRSRHRISQRAVESIGKLGGSGSGITAALSTGLLRFFDDFNYEHLGISCKLTNEVCAMNGVEPAKQGYYLVKGRGLPRIDVIGNAERVDWPLLVAQLKAATESDGPIVK